MSFVQPEVVTTTLNRAAQQTEMSMYTTKGFDSSSRDGWERIKQEILAAPSYQRFLSVTSDQDLAVVENRADFSELNQENNCHENCQRLEELGMGTAVSGWYVLCDTIFNEVPTGVCRLVHHCNLQLQDGLLINPTIDNINLPFHLFLRDDKRRYDLDQEIGYNDRMVFSDAYEPAPSSAKSVPRNKVLFARDDYYSRDLAYERFKGYKTIEELAAAVPKSLSDQDRELWMALKVA